MTGSTRAAARAGRHDAANVVATSNLFLATSPDKATYQARLSAYKDDLVARGLITGKQGGKMLACAAKLPASKVGG